MTYNDKRNRGVILQVLDLSALEAQALEFRQRTRPDCYEAKIYGGKIAMKESRNGHIYTVCIEGVGPENGVTFDDPLEVEFHGSYYIREESRVDENGNTILGEIIPGSHTFDFMSFGSTTLNPDELRSYPVLEEVDLADFIRSFGQRLELNFQLWYSVLG